MQLKLNAIIGMQFTGVLHFSPVDGVEQKLFKKLEKMLKNQHFTFRVRLMQFKVNAITGMQFTGVLHFPPARWRWRGGPFR